MARKIALSNAKKAPFTLPEPDASLAAERRVMAAFAHCTSTMVAWRTSLGKQTPRYSKDKEPQDYTGKLTLTRGRGGRAGLVQREGDPYTLTAHQGLLLAQARVHARDAFLALEQALLAIPALRSPALGLSMVHAAWSSEKGPRMGLYHTFAPYNIHPRSALETSMALLRGVSITLNDPIWMISSARIPAPDAETALYIHLALTSPHEPVKIAASGGTPVVRLDNNLHLQQTVAQRLHAAQHRLTHR